MIHIAEELQTFLFTALSTDTDLTNLGVTGVFDKIPDNQNYPYIRIDNIDATNFDNHSDSGFSGELTVKTFDRDTSSLRIKRIQSRIYAILHDWNVTMTNFKKINFKCKLSNDTIENDSITQNGTSVFEFIFARI